VRIRGPAHLGELLEAGLSPDDNYYRDPAGNEIFSLWYYHEKTGG
jgi:hypothetical protein